MLAFSFNPTLSGCVYPCCVLLSFGIAKVSPQVIMRLLRLITYAPKQINKLIPLFCLSSAAYFMCED